MHFSLDAAAQRDLRRWLWIAVFCLAVGGLYALPLAAGRGLKNVTEAQIQHLFNIVLVVHVDLSIFLWFLAMVMAGWRLAVPLLGQGTWVKLPFFQPASQALFAAGAVLMALSPLLADGEGLRSNYIPVLTNGAFFLSLALVAAGLVIALLETLFSLPPRALLCAAFARDLRIGPLCAYATWGSALIVAVSLAAFSASAERMDPIIRGEAYYDMVFWAGGHAIQFAYAQAAMLVWLLLAHAVGLLLPFGNRAHAALLTLNLLAMLYVPWPYLHHAVDSLEFRDAFTRLMIWGNGLAPSLLMLVLLGALVRQWSGIPRLHAFTAALLSSLVLFLYGGFLATLIEGQNVVIPAHYHGSIVGITLAFMGLAYWLLPRLGYADVQRWKLAVWAPIILCVGQMIHVSALAWSGGYGVLRKTVGTDGYPPEVRLAMGLLGGGSGLASLGGLLFVIVVVRAWRKRPQNLA
jgi:heme/copper-type cytochrome/quinol oxidase subunit 1